MSDFYKLLKFDHEFPGTYEPRVQIVRHGEVLRGTKLASAATDYIKNVEPEAGKTFILVLAMSASEYYGANRNNDAFSERPVENCVKIGETLPEHTKTFEDHAKVYAHHMNKNPDKNLGDVVRAWYDFQMHRVELLLKIDNIRGADVIKKIDAGQNVAVSMGTKIPYDVCSIRGCHNKAATRADYCEHMKFQAGDLLPDGQKVFVYNPSPKFFDISVVVRPADKIAFMMKKVADHDVGIPYGKTSAELGEQVQLLDAKMAAAKKIADLTKMVKCEPLETSNLPKEEVIIGKGFIEHSLPKILDKREDFKEETIDKLSHYSLSKTLSTLADQGLDPTAGEMTSLVIHKMHPGCKVAESLKTAADMLAPAIMQLMANDPRLTDAVTSSGLFDIDSNYVDDKIASYMEPYMEKRSNLKRFLYMNAIPEFMRPDEPGRWNQVETRDPVTGQQYVTTRGAADMANNANVKRQLGLAAGTGLLTGGAYKILRAMNHPYLAAGALAGGALAGKGLWNAFSVPNMPTNGPQAGHLTVPASSEMRKVSSLVIPALATAALITLLGQEHENATEHGEFEENEKSSIKEMAAAHPAITMLAGLLLASAGHDAFKTASVPDEFIKVSEDGNETVDLIKFSEWLGEGLLALSELVAKRR